MQGPSDFRCSLKWHGAKPRTPALYRSFRNHRLCYSPLQGLHTAWFPQSGCIDLFHLFALGLWSDLCRDVYDSAMATALAIFVIPILFDMSTISLCCWSTILHPWAIHGLGNLVWLQVKGIQFPTDHSNDPVLFKCVCVCVFTCWIFVYIWHNYIPAWYFIHIHKYKKKHLWKNR